MEVRKPVLELKDVPPPPLHSTGTHPCLGPPQTHPGSLSVSVCSRCEASIHPRQSRSEAGGGTGGGFPLFLSQTDTRTPPHPSSLAQSGGAPLQTPASFGTASAAHCHAPCCAGLRQLRVCSLCKPAPSGVCRCRRAQQHPFSHGDPSSPSHLCSNSLHLGVGHAPPCVKGAHCLQDCWRKSLHVDSEKVWPNIPPPVPVCNGCGVTGSSSDGLLGVHLGKTPQKYGPPESEALPPIGVFWDIENCAVPSGRSAATVVQRLRERFFQGYREAEFICVCDINKENKAVIQELNNCQVTVAHINATAKNAADDKLRQSLRRFAETHAAPATVIVVSSDVNFASELSDLRHRHGFQVILVHKSQASSALLQHAHLRFPFEEFVSDLPPGMIVKSQPSFSLLFVHHLPTHRDAKAVANRLQRLSNNCGGKVLGVSGGCAVLRFASADAAERARKRMENEDVLGHRIVVSFSPDGPEEEEERRPLAASSSSVFLPVEKPRSPRRPRRASRSCQGGSHAPERPYSPRRAGHASSCSPVMKLLPQAVSAATRPATASPQSLSVLPAAGKLAEMPQRSRRRDSPGQPFQVSTPSAFSKLSLQRSFSPMMVSQSSWSSRSASPCLSNRSSPLSAPSPSSCADGLVEPFSDGVDVQVTNLDYRMSRKDLQQILRDAFAKHGRVKSVDLSPHTDYQLKARVHMSSLQQAIGAVSLLHRYKIGSKRIQVSLVTGAGNNSLTGLSSEIISILQDAPANCLPLYKFTETYERKFGHKLVVSDLYRLPEVVCVREQGGGRLVCLLSSTQARQSPLGSAHSHDSSNTASPVLFEELEYHEPVCKRHCTQQDFSESDFDPDSYMIPFVLVSLKVLAAHVHSLLQSHEGTVPLLRILRESSYKRTVEEVERTRQFGKEVVDLLRHQPHFRMPFSKFIPTYHHHFGRQCKLSYYGFTKLMELFEAIPDVLLVLECGEERLLALTEVERVKALAAQLVKLLRAQRDSGLPVSQLLSEYSKTFGYSLRLQDYDAATLPALLNKLCHVVKVVDAPEGKEVQLINRKSLRALTSQLLALMMSLPEDRDHLGVEELRKQYELTYAAPLNPCEYGFISLTELLKSLPYLLQLSEDERDDGGAEERVRLTRLYQFARSVRALLHTYHYNQIFLSEFCGAFGKYTGREFQPQAYGYKTLEELLAAVPQVVWIKGHGHKKIIVLKNDMRARGSPALSDSPVVAADEPHPEEEPRFADSPVSGEMELLCLGSGSPVDLLCAPVPSCLPSPQLRPDPVQLQPRDLIRFEPRSHGPSEREPVYDRQPMSAHGHLAPSTSENGPDRGANDAPEPSSAKTCVTDSPGRRTARNRVKLAANFSLTSALSV
ncbi:meiosis regulator and mRNA stability factor 1 [Garra rufa]|uniref:meiosis regulator and mRNA stability factor 1 n=1 Tax=Garra rufa TaxID=137080 RepID=UPI003CCE86E2